MITFGDKQIPAEGVNDDSDSFDAPEGTCAVCDNFLAARNSESWVNRGGFALDLNATPSTVYNSGGTNKP